MCAFYSIFYLLPGKESLLAINGVLAYVRLSSALFSQAEFRNR